MDTFGDARRNFKPNAHRAKTVIDYRVTEQQLDSTAIVSLGKYLI
ncbi:hypothetical protein [Yoonia sp.]|nr:hypothetical protein [Yoonia sp.]